MGGGGYVSGPVGLAATSIGLPLVLTEADSHLGLANRLLAGRAKRVCLAFPIEGRNGDRYLVTGRPVPDDVLNADRNAARHRWGLGPDARCVLVFGGSQGARTINEAAIDAFSGDTRDFHVLHISGSRDYESLRERYEAAAPANYTLIERAPSLGEALAASDLVVSRSGGSVFEIAAAGRPAILVPYPHATADHQTTNAAWMVEAGAALVIEDSRLTPALLATTTAQLITDRARLEQMATASRHLARPDAAREIAREVLAAVEGR